MKTVGIDIGNNAVKVASTNGATSFLSITGRTYEQTFSLAAQEGIFLMQPPIVVGEAAAKFSPEEIRLQNRDLFHSDMYLALYYAALSEVCSGSGDMRVVAGLPVSLFRSECEAVKARLSGSHTFQRVGRRAQTLTIDARLMPQGMAAMCNVLMTNSGRLTDEALAMAHLGVIDIGGGTVGFVHLYELSTVESETFSINTGGNDVIARFNALLSTNYRGLDLRDSEAFLALKTGQTMFDGKLVDVRELAAEATRPLAAQIVTALSQKWRSASKFSMILVTGGGAFAVGQTITAKYPHAVLDKDPIMGNALGYWKMANRSLAEEA